MLFHVFIIILFAVELELPASRVLDNISANQFWDCRFHVSFKSGEEKEDDIPLATEDLKLSVGNSRSFERVWLAQVSASRVKAEPKSFFFLEDENGDYRFQLITPYPSIDKLSKAKSLEDLSAILGSTRSVIEKDFKYAMRWVVFGADELGALNAMIVDAVVDPAANKVLHLRIQESPLREIPSSHFLMWGVRVPINLIGFGVPLLLLLIGLRVWHWRSKSERSGVDNKY